MIDFVNGVEETLLEEYSAGLPVRYWKDDGIDDDGSYQPDSETVVNDLVTKELHEREEKRWCKSRVCFRRNGTPKGSWLTVSCKSGQQAMIDKLRVKYPDITEVLNEKRGEVY